MAIDEVKVAEIKGWFILLQEWLQRLTRISAKLEERDNLIREAWVKSMEIRLVRDELSKCHLAEGVNHYENCKWLADKYLGMLRTTKVGYVVVVRDFWH